jgi:cysteine desulfurase family protein
MIYLDNAATTWPKPPEVIRAMSECMESFAANPGRGSHQMSLKASRIVNETRQQLSSLFGVTNPADIVFTQNATEALNLAIKGFLRPGDHVVTTSLEHNAVRRPLEFMKNHGVSVTYVPAETNGTVSVKKIEEAITRETRLVVVTHGSNLTGTVIPVEEIGRITRARGIRLLVDAAQTAGVFPIDVEAMGIDMLAFTGHKSLYGPQGTGGLYIHPEVVLTPLLHGGSGGQSELPDMPPNRPDRYEAGTRNTVGIAGLGAGLSFVKRTGIDVIRKHEQELANLLSQELQAIPGVHLFGPSLPAERVPIVSFQVEGFDSTEIGFILDQHYQIAVRTGLHCAPLAHETLGTLQGGLVRVSVGFFNTRQEIHDLADAIREIVS